MQKLLQEIQDLSRRRFGGEVLTIAAPGRINLIGEHTDYNLGFVVPAAIDKQIYFAMGKHSGNQVEIYSFNYQTQVSLDLENLKLSSTASWYRYFEAMLLELASRNYHPTGIHLVFGGDIPIGAGLSSSAALCCGFIYGLSELMNWGIPRAEIALIARATEHRVELNCGLMDQYAVLFGQKDQVFCLDCKDLSFAYFPLKLDGYRLVLIDSKVSHQLAVDSEYNARRQSCEKVVDLISKTHPEIKSLRDLGKDLLEKYQNQLDPKDFVRAAYVLKENQRVLDALEALKKGDLETVGSKLYESHEGLQKEYEVSIEALDLLIELSKKEKDILGARMMGGGFGGCTLNLILEENKEEVLNRILEAYFQKTRTRAAFYEVKLCDGIRKLI